MQIPNPKTRNLPYSAVPWIDPTVFVAPIAIISGDVAVHLDRDVSVLHNASLHGPLRIGHNTWIGRLAEAGQVVRTQADADALPPVPADLVSLNPRTVQGCYELGKGCRRLLTRI